MGQNGSHPEVKKAKTQEEQDDELYHIIWRKIMESKARYGLFPNYVDNPELVKPTKENNYNQEKYDERRKKLLEEQEKELRAKMFSPEKGFTVKDVAIKLHPEYTPPQYIDSNEFIKWQRKGLLPSRDLMAHKYDVNLGKEENNYLAGTVAQYICAGYYWKAVGETGCMWGLTYLAQKQTRFSFGPLDKLIKVSFARDIQLGVVILSGLFFAHQQKTYCYRDFVATFAPEEIRIS